MASWDDLRDELDRWSEAGRVATLWWRDDDAADRTPAVERLIGLAESAGIRIHLAVIPAPLTDRLTGYVLASPWPRVLQHGYAHINYAPKGTGNWELGDHRPKSVVLDELEAGRVRLEEHFGERFLPVLVPPWTRIAESLVPDLTGVGFVALSMEGARPTAHAAPGLLTLNAHCDPIKWKGGPRFTGTERALDEIVRHLSGRREGSADLTEPTGLCTHHLAHDAATWGFVEEFVHQTVSHPGARWIGLESGLGRAPAA